MKGRRPLWQLPSPRAWHFVSPKTGGRGTHARLQGATSQPAHRPAPTLPNSSGSSRWGHGPKLQGLPGACRDPAGVDCGGLVLSLVERLGHLPAASPSAPPRLRTRGRAAHPTTPASPNSSGSSRWEHGPKWLREGSSSRGSGGSVFTTHYGHRRGLKLVCNWFALQTRANQFESGLVCKQSA